MNVVRLPSQSNTDRAQWRPAELKQLESIFAFYAREGIASEWAVGVTELGDPQFFVFGPPPESDCVVSISRVRGRYVAEDGSGSVLAEHDQIERLAEQPAQLVPGSGRAKFVAKIVLAWYALRDTVQQKLEAAVAEPVELVTHFAPQLAALA